MEMELNIAAPTTKLTALDSSWVVGAEAAGDRERFAQLYRRHYQAIAGYVYRRVGDAHTTEDLVADVFLGAFRALPRYRDRGLPVRAWFYRIATNRINRWARRERGRALKQLASETAAAEPARAESLADTEYAQTVLLTLAPRYQAVLALHYLEGMPIEKVARTLGCRVGTVKSRLARGREALRRRLEQRRLS